MLIISTNSKNCPLAVREKATGGLVFVEDNDNAAICRLKEEAEKHDASGGKRLECYLILNDQTSLWLMQTVGLPKEIGDKVDVVGNLEINSFNLTASGEYKIFKPI